MRLFGVIGSPGFPTDQAELRRQLERGVRRALYPVGPYQQLLAIIAAGDRRRELAMIRVPTLVIHGADDPLLPVAAGTGNREAHCRCPAADHQGNGTRPATGGAGAAGGGNRQSLPGSRQGPEPGGALPWPRPGAVGGVVVISCRYRAESVTIRLPSKATVCAPFVGIPDPPADHL
jgi:hypothetical protein